MEAAVLPNASSAPSKVPHPDEFNPYFAYVGAGIFFFTVVNYFTRYTVPSTAASSFQQSWKWRNIATSLVHSLITAVWAPLGFYLHPDMCRDVAYAFNHSAHILVSFSIGYFIYDFLDMYLFNQKNRQKNTSELLVHHACAISCFGLSSHTRTLLPFASLSLVVEVNSVFLHIRQLFIIAGVAREYRTAYRNVALLNVATFVLFRILLIGWMARWLTINKDNLPVLFFSASSVGVSVILGMNAVLFYRILNRDFFAKEGGALVSGSSASNGEATNVVLRTGPVSKDVNRIMKDFFDGGGTDNTSSALPKEKFAQAKKDD